MEENYKVDLGNGTVLENLILNGTDFESSEEVIEETFDGMENVVVTDGNGNETVYDHPELVYCRQMGIYYCFCIRNMSEAELKANATDAQVLYTALMTDTLIEEE